MKTDLNNLVSQVRRDILRMVHNVQSGHPGGSRSKVHAMVVTLLSGAMRWDIRDAGKRFADRYVLVAGHTNPVVYATLAVLNEALRIKFKQTKLENAVGILNWIYDYNHQRPIDKVVWGYRAKPRGIPNNHAGDIFVFFRNGEKIGVSLKAGTAKSKDPIKNT